MADLSRQLDTFAEENGFRGKGSLCVALVVTQYARDLGLPLDPKALITRGGGQVLGLGKSAVQNVLHRHGILQILAAEGGRTSRGSISKMRAYVGLLNTLASDGNPDLDAIELFWVNRVRQFFAGKPFRLNLRTSQSLGSTVSDLLGQAARRQANSPGTNLSGAVLQHLVGAKLECALGEGETSHHEFTGGLAHHSVSTADSPTGRPGDFCIGDVAIHVTVAPSEAVIRKCERNIEEGLRPVLVTISRQRRVASTLAENLGLTNRIDVFDIEQFISLNVYEMGRFRSDGRKRAVSDLVDRYNEIIDKFETDPSLKISPL